MSDTIEFPLRLEDTLFINAAFPIPTSNARKLLPTPARVHLVEGFPGQALLIVAFALYRRCAVGAYAEATLALLATHERTTPIITLSQLLKERRYPAYVLHMLVNSSEAQKIGSSIWQLPRQMAEVHVVEQHGRATCEALLAGRRVVQLVAERPDTNRTCTMQIETYVQDSQGLIHTVMPCKAEAYGRTQGGGGTLRWGNHPIGQRLANLGVKAQPLMVRYYDHMLAELHAPQRYPLAERE